MATMKTSTVSVKVQIDCPLVGKVAKKIRASPKLHHGGAGCRDSVMAVTNQPALPPGASLEGVERGQCARVLFNLADQAFFGKCRG